MTARAHLTVDLGDRSYPIEIGAGCLATVALDQYVAGRQVMVVSNATVAGLYLPAVRERLGNAVTLDVVHIGDGERFKSLATYGEVMDALIARRHNRTTTVIALGGGVVGDLAGFVAATYQRGVAFVQIPTTLLAQVDSSVGGKTAVNHPGGKNLIGAFYQPRCVVADVATLVTLPQRELRAGLAEVIKYGVISDAGFFAWLETHMDALLAVDADAMVHAVERSCAIKAQVVAADERETGVRAILNFGHTFGHAIEALTGYEAYLHGEAVAIGMVMAADYSARCGRLDWADARRIKALVDRAGLPTVPPDLDRDAVLEAMGMDKKVVDGRLRLVLADALGTAAVSDDVAFDLLAETLGAAGDLCIG